MSTTSSAYTAPATPRPTPRDLADGGISRRVRFGAAGLAALLAFAVYAVSNLTAWGQHTENVLIFGSDETQAVAYVPYSDLRLPPLHGETGAIVVGFLLAIGIAVVRRRWRDVATVAVAVPASVLFDDAVARALVKPALDPGSAVWTLASSFPSGHVVIVAAVSTALAIVVPRRWLTWCLPILGAWTALVSSAVLALGWHRPSDLLGAVLIVAAFFLAASAVFVPRTSPVELTGGRIVPTLAVIIAFAAVFALQPAVWATPVFAVFGALATVIALVVALRLLRLQE